MNMQFAVVLMALWATALAAPPLSRDHAVLGHIRLEKLMSFIDAQLTWVMNDHFTTCRSNSQIFNDTCHNVDASTQCSEWRCSNPQYTNQTSCQFNHASWREEEKKNRCCSSMNEKECKYNDDGTEEIACCDVCVNAAQIIADGHATQSQVDEYCSATGYTGPSVCGATAGVCGHCLQDADKNDQGWCTGSGTCSDVQGRLWQYSDQSSCTQNNGTWTVNQWEVNTSAVTEEACYAGAYCGLCFNQSLSSHYSSEGDCRNSAGKCSCEGQNSCPGDKSSCQSQGHIWHAAVWQKDYSVKTESECSLKGTKYSWKESAQFEAGTVIPASPLHPSATGCSTGPSHVADGRVDGLSGDEACANDTQLLQDAASGLSAQEAIQGNAFFYKKQLHRMIGPRGFLRAIVTNNATNVVDRARIVLAKSACFAALVEPQNKGQVLVEDGPKTNILIVRPTNYADADAINIMGGTARVLGGTNAGSINAATSGKLEIYGITNSGPVQCSISQDILIANVQNLAGGSVVVTDVSATLINIFNEGNVSVKGPAHGATAQGGQYTAYDIVNKGSVNIEAGTIHIATICPSSGTITIAAGVTGNVTYESGCRGTINAPNTVTVSAIDKKQTVISGTVGLTVPDADAFLADTTAKDALKDGIAASAGVPSSYVMLDVAKVRRLAQGDAEMVFRQLAGTSISITYSITVPQTVSTATAAQAASKLATVTVAELNKIVATQVAAAKGFNYAVKIISKAAPTVAKLTTTTTTTMEPTTTDGSQVGSSGSTTTTVAGSTTVTTTILQGVLSSGVVPLPCFWVLALFLSGWAWSE